MGKTAIFLMLFTLISKVSGLIREQFFAYYLGNGMISDSYNTAMTIPTIIFGFVLAGVIAGYIPIYSKAEYEHGEKRAKEFTANLVNILIVITTIIIFAIIIFAPALVSIFASGYEGDKREITIRFTRLMSFSLYATMISSVFIGFLQMKKRFIIAESAGLFMNFLNVIVLVLAFKFSNMYILPLGYVLSEYLKYILFPHFVKKEGYKHKFIFDIHDEYIKNMLRIAIPIFLSIAAVDISTIVDQSLASTMITHGGVSSMRRASLILTLVSGIIVASITTSIYPQMSKYASRKEIGRVKKTIMDGNIYSFILIIPSMIGVMILSEPLIKLLFERGNFDVNSTAITSSILVFYMPTIVGQSINQIFTRGFYSMNNTKTPILITFVQVFSNIVLNYVFSYNWGFGLGLNGLALATSVSSFIGGVLSAYLFRQKYGRINFKKFSINGLKILLTSLIMGIATYFTYHGLSSKNYILAFLISIIVSILVYAIVILFMRIPEVTKLINILYSRIKKKRRKANIK
ncbi:murein biosynthesis integral membrane protein MurJ [Helcococcus kunzii]|uniref:murein biosynthesis integral membrane protein MurJ n=1 Tax=Helcococcus kunzii TaxID=40091 RepID=UPI0021A8D3FC|nr:murein biosynthesis integral membrane protein MurJ [Helcococcus kunzii]MCT1795817.1 murein biosynthesis integral membrane protein MurJ [Helcococcus kunzii]MCT1989396.1 murein biosynthesis integral membrane protein MurJ [Helcococcus kunzii]